MAIKQIFENKNILITGGAGFVGSHLCQRLVEKNKIICIDNLSTGDEKNIDFLLRHPNFEFIKHDLTKPINMEELPELQKFKLRWQGIQEIFHLAVPASPAHFSKNAISISLANSLGTKNVLDMAINYKAKFLFVSSSVIYGRVPPGEEIKESYNGGCSPVGRNNCYVEGKRFAESLIDGYKKIHQLDTKIARVFTTYGPKMKLDDGRTISNFVKSAMENKDLIIEGDQNVRNSYCYIDDLIDGIIRLMKSEEHGPINIGSSEAIPVVEVAKKVIANTSSNSSIVFKQAERDVLRSPIPNIAMAKEYLSWEPVILLDAGLKKTIDYLKASKSLLGFSQGGARM